MATLENFEPGPSPDTAIYAARGAAGDIGINRLISGLEMDPAQIPRSLRKRMPQPGGGCYWHLFRLHNLQDLAAITRRLGFADRVEWRRLPYSVAARSRDAEALEAHLGESLAEAAIDGASGEELAEQFLEDLATIREARP